MKIGLIGIVNDAAKADFWGTMQQVAEIGYEGIEGADYPLSMGDVPENLRRFRALGLEVLTAGASREDLSDKFDALRERAIAVESPRVTVWWSPANDRDELLRDAELYNRRGATLAQDGIKLCYHNHDHEFRNVFDGMYALDILTYNTDPAAVYFNIDIGWVAVGGEDPARVLRRLAGRVPAIHIKDFADLSDRKSFTAVGTGVVPIVAALQAAEETRIPWGIVEQDRLRSLSPIETITVSYLNLKERGLNL